VHGKADNSKWKMAFYEGERNLMRKEHGGNGKRFSYWEKGVGEQQMAFDRWQQCYE
jgi:hypothetical protein